MYAIVQGARGARLTDGVASLPLPDVLSDLEMLVDMLVDHLSDVTPEGVYFTLDEMDERPDTSPDWRDGDDEDGDGDDE